MYFYLKIPPKGTAPGMCLEAENNVYSSAGKAVHRIKVKPDGASKGRLPWEMLYSSRITHVSLTAEVSKRKEIADY